MNIVFLCRPWPVFGGGETVTITLANEMAKRGFQVHVLFTNSRSATLLPYIDERIKAVRVPNVKATEEIAFDSADVNSANAFLSEYIQKYHIDAVINQWWPCECLEGLKDKTKLIKCLHTAPFYPSSWQFLTWSGRDLIKRLCGKRLFNYLQKVRSCYKMEHDFEYVHLYVFLVKSFLNDYREFRGKNVLLSKLAYVNNPVVLSFTLSDVEFKKKEKLVLCVARLYERSKRISYMIRIWAEIEKDERFADWKFEIVGDGPSLEMYKQMVRTLGLKRISFMGRQIPDSFYKRAKIFLMTSAIEGWGMTLVEAQQGGVVPIVSETFSSVHDIITDGETGRIVPMHQWKQYENVLKETMLNDVHRERMARNAMVTCQKYAVDKIVDNWEYLIEGIKL